MNPLYLLYLPLIFVLYIFTKHFFHKLNNLPPTPLLTLPFLGHLHLLKKPLQRSLANISDRYGPVVLLNFGSRRVLVVSSPAAAEECFTKNDVIFANRPNLLAGKHLGYNFTSMSWTPYGDHWRNLRKISSIEILSTRKLQMLHDIRADEIKSMIRALCRASSDRKLTDMKTVFFELTMNVVMRMIAGKRYYGEYVEEAEEAGRFRQMAKDTFRLGTSHMGDFLPVVRWLGIGSAEKQLAELQSRRESFMQEVVEECKTRFKKIYGSGEKETKTKSMIEMLLVLQEKEPDYYTDSLIRSLMMVILAAGSDTTAGTMEWALSSLLNNPHVLKRVRMEIDDHVGPNRLLDESDVPSLPYLNCIINETLRMYPAAPLLIPHESSDECSVGGYRVPSGTMLLVNVWAIQNDPKNWEEPTEFRPERFEANRVDGFRSMPFGAGRRSCPGEGLAVRMLGFGLGSIIQCFDWERPRQELIDMSEGVGITLPKATPLMAYCKTRPIADKFFLRNK